MGDCVYFPKSNNILKKGEFGEKRCLRFIVVLLGMFLLYIPTYIVLAHDARCKVCNHFGEYANHTYEYYVYDEETHNMKCTICLYESNGTHNFVYNPSLGKDECEDCGYVSE